MLHARPLLLLALSACTSCVHVLSYTPRDVRREATQTAYRLAVARLQDGRRLEAGEERTVEGQRVRRLPDAKLSFLGSNFADALVKRLDASGYFGAVVREAPYVKAHLLLTGTVKRFRAEVNAADLDQATRRTEEAERAGKVAPDAKLRVRSRASVTLYLWRVDRRGQITALDSLSFSTHALAIKPTLGAATDAVFAAAVDQAAGTLLSALRKERAVAGDLPQGATRLRVVDARGRTQTVTSTWVEDQPKWGELNAAAKKRWPLPPHTDPPVELGPLP